MRFSEFFSQNKKVISFEFFPPNSNDKLPATKAMIRELAEFAPDFMTVTYGAGGGTRAMTRDLVGFINN